MEEKLHFLQRTKAKTICKFAACFNPLTSKSRFFMYRSHTCGELRIADVGTKVTLAGWVQKTRDKGAMVWLDLRDRYGITQLFFGEEVSSAELLNSVRKIGREFVVQAEYVLKERLNLLKYATEHYDDGLLFFYFSSTDLQSHMLWWDSDEKHPTRSESDARKYFNHIKDLYRKLDDVVGDILKHYNDTATVIVMSDHGFARFKRQFNLNTFNLAM